MSNIKDIPGIMSPVPLRDVRTKSTDFAKYLETLSEDDLIEEIYYWKQKYEARDI